MEKLGSQYLSNSSKETKKKHSTQENRKTNTFISNLDHIHSSEQKITEIIENYTLVNKNQDLINFEQKLDYDNIEYVNAMMEIYHIVCHTKHKFIKLLFWSEI